MQISKRLSAWRHALLTAVFILLSFAAIRLTSIDVVAYGCKNPEGSELTISFSCPCGPHYISGDRCAGRPGGCDLLCCGHKWKAYKDSYVSGYKPRTCTTDGTTTITYTVYYKCIYGDGCNKSYPGSSNPITYTTAYHTGHAWSGWQSNYDYHWKVCTNAWHNNAIDGSNISNYAAHSKGGEYQANDHRWHINCAVCGYVNRWNGPNQAKTLFITSGATEASEGDWDKYVSSPGYRATGNVHLLGYDRGTTEKTYHVDATTGRLASWEVGLSTSKSLHEWATYYSNTDYCLNNRYAARDSYYGRYAAVWEYNYVTVNYHTGYLGDEVLPTRYVDATQTLTTEKQSIIPNRPGYDVADNGWFVSGANTTNKFVAHTTTTYNNYSTYHLVHFIDLSASAYEDSTREVYEFGKNYGAGQYNAKSADGCLI